MCSLAAQGLWMRMLCICAEAEPAGYLFVSGKPVSPEGLASLVGKTVEEVKKCLDDLESNLVFSRDRNGNIFNRRMIQQEKKRKTNQKNGSAGGKASVRKQRGIFQSLGSGTEQETERHTERQDEQPPERPPEPHGRGQKPEAKERKEEEGHLSSEELQDLGWRCIDAFEMDRKQFMGHFSQIRDIVAVSGATPDQIVEICRSLKARPNFKPGGNPFPYLAKSAADELAKLRTAAAEAGPAFATPQAENDFRWRTRLTSYRDRKIWSGMWGAKPEEPDCEAPIELLIEFGYRRAA